MSGHQDDECGQHREQPGQPGRPRMLIMGFLWACRDNTPMEPYRNAMINMNG